MLVPPRDVQQLRAQCGGDPIELTIVDLDTWRSGPRPCSPLLVRYAVYANSDPPFSSSLNDEHAFFNPATLLFYLPRERARTVRVKFVLPPGWNHPQQLMLKAQPDQRTRRSR